MSSSIEPQVAKFREKAIKFGDRLIYILGVILGILLIYYAHSFYATRVRHTNLVLGLCISLYYLTLFRDTFKDEDSDIVEDKRAFSVNGKTTVGAKLRQSNKIERMICIYSNFGRPVFYASLAFLALILMIYVDINHQRWMGDAQLTGYSNLDYVVAALIIFMCTDITIRSFGVLMGSIVPLGFLYGLFGPYLPGVFYHSGMGLKELLRVSILGMEGVYGFILEVGATWVAIFLLLAGFAKAYDILDYLMEVSREISKIFRSGIIHAAIAASIAFGSITGASAANTATTGSFTIPMMKNQGIDKGYAGGIETVASIGGQLVPPIMGIAAFLMADLLGVSYTRIIQAGLIPAILFYGSLVVSAQLVIYKHGWTTTVERQNIEYHVFKDLVWYFIPFAVLIYTLAILQWSPLAAGYWTVLTLFGTITVKYVYEQGKLGPRNVIKDTADGLRTGAVDMAPLLVILGAIGVIISVFVQTGFSQRLNTTMIGLAGGSVLMLLILAMSVSLIFGLGMPAPAAYILVATLAGTAMVQFGIREITAHLFVFYFAMYSSLTPPVGPSTIVAAKIAGSSYWDTAVQAVRFALSGFLVPFIFIANGSLIYWEMPQTIFVFFAVMMGVIALNMAIFSYDGQDILSPFGRSVYFLLAVLAFFGPYLGLINSSIQLGTGITILVLILSRFLLDAPRFSTIRSLFHS